MHIANFDDLLQAARRQPEPQRLLFVFAQAELPEPCTAEQRAAFEAGEGGTLVPLMSVDKSPDELDTFDSLLAESRQHAAQWAVVFVAGLAGRNGFAPSDQEADRSMQRMVDAVRAGEFGLFMPFDRQGNVLLFG